MQNDAKESLHKLVVAGQGVISPEGSQLITRWAAMTVCVMASLQDGMGIDDSELKKVMKGEPLENWAVFVGRYLGTSWNAKYSTLGMTFGLEGDETLKAMQVTTFGLGRAAFHVASSTVPLAPEFIRVIERRGLTLVSHAPNPTVAVSFLGTWQDAHLERQAAEGKEFLRDIPRMLRDAQA